jgi:hypothetical protein
MLINCDCKTVREKPENILLHTKLENRALSTRHLSLESSTNMTNLTARNLKLFQVYMSVTQVYHLPSYVILGKSPQYGLRIIKATIAFFEDNVDTS